MSGSSDRGIGPEPRPDRPYVAARWTRYLFVYLALLAGCSAFLAVNAGQRWTVLITAAVAIVINLVGVLTGLIRIRRKADPPPRPILQGLISGSAGLVAVIVADGLIPMHQAPFLVHAGELFAALSGSFALAVIGAALVRRHNQ